MKKNKMMRIASILLVAVLISTCAISGTFAKYVSKGEAEDAARVAKWGVLITAEGDLFGDAYANVKGGNTPVEFDAEKVADLSITVANDKEEKLVAPGTKNDKGIGITVTGTPEVAFELAVKAEIALEGWEIPYTATATEEPGENSRAATADEGEEEPAAEVVEYCPIVFTVNGKQYMIDYSTEEEVPVEETTRAESNIVLCDDVDDLIEKVTAAIEEASKEYPALTDLSGEDAVALDISWEWPFEVNDEYDTALGNQAADGNAATISVAVTVSATQID